MSQTRRTQAERTAATRAALLQATIDTLVDQGYRRTTTQAIAKRAGTSYGALLHHFPTKADLLCAAVRHMLDQRTAEFRKAMADLPPGSSTAEAAIDVLWSIFQTPTYVAWHEMWTASRTDADIAEAMKDVDTQFMETSTEIFRELFADETSQDPNLPRLAVGLTYAFLDGLASGQLLRGHQAGDPDELLAIFKMLVTPALPAPQENS
jgi:AcrR family transcriptional regulator